MNTGIQFTGTTDNGLTFTTFPPHGPCPTCGKCRCCAPAAQYIPQPIITTPSPYTQAINGGICS